MARRTRPLRTFEFPVEFDGVLIGHITYNRIDGYGARRIDGAHLGDFDSRDEAETELIAQRLQPAA